MEDEKFTVTSVIKCLPKEVFEKNNGKAFKKLISTLFFFGVSIFVLSIAPWYLLPFAWFYASLTMIGLFAIAHDCGHESFFEASVLNKIVGNICLVPIFYPLEAWKLHHNLHHKNEKSKRGLEPQQSKSFFRLINPIFWPYDIVKLVLLYFDLSQFKVEEQKQASLSVLCTYASIGILFPLMIYNLGIWGLVKFWFMPWILFHFWKNTLRQALPSVSLSYPPRSNREEWVSLSTPMCNSEVKKELLTEMTHYSFPIWFEFFGHDINYQIPHYLCPQIPCYNLKKAHKALLASKWNQKINQYRFGLFLLFPKKKEAGTEQTAISQKQRELEEAYPDLKVPAWKRINWLHVPLFTMTHSLAIIGLLTTSLSRETFVWAVIYYYLTGLGITAGYHRLWAHRAYDASYPVRLLLMIFGSGAVEGSIKWWGRDHRIHHRYTDTPYDPYNAKRGFWYSHMGWMLFKEPNKPLGKVNIDDFEKDPMIRWQHKNYLPLAAFMAFIFPTLVAGLGWGDWRGGFFYAGVIRLCFVHHATFFVNSLAHTLGHTTFADRHTPRDSFITAILTLGEGYHNFHHEFPKDYRNAIKFYQYDPTKWVIRVLAFFGMAYNLHKFPENEVKKGSIQMARKKIDRMAMQVDWGYEIEALPEYTMEKFNEAIKKGEKLIIIGNVVHDVSKWENQHPGGAALIRTFIGKDATSAFNGGVYNHSNAGRNMLTQLRIGRLKTEEQLHDHPPPLDDALYEIEYQNSTKTA